MPRNSVTDFDVSLCTDEISSNWSKGGYVGTQSSPVELLETLNRNTTWSRFDILVIDLFIEQTLRCPQGIKGPIPGPLQTIVD